MFRIIKIIKGDWKAITYSVLAAITFWFINALNMDYSVDVSHPLIIHYDEESYTPIEDLPSEINFSTTASGWDIFTKTNFINSVPIEIDLENFKKRKYITASRLKLLVAKQMDGIQINEVLDDTLYVNFDKISSKKIKFKVNTKALNLKEGYKITGDINIKPSEITITGAASVLNKIGAIQTIDIQDKDISGNYEENIPLKDIIYSKINFDVPEVEVQFETTRLESVEKSISISKLHFPKRKGITISENEVTLIYYARKEDLEKLKSEKLEAIVDFNKLNDKDKTIKITLKNVPDLIQRYQFKPSTVSISYAK